MTPSCYSSFASNAMGGRIVLLYRTRSISATHRHGYGSGTDRVHPAFSTLTTSRSPCRNKFGCLIPTTQLSPFSSVVGGSASSAIPACHLMSTSSLGDATGRAAVAVKDTVSSGQNSGAKSSATLLALAAGAGLVSINSLLNVDNDSGKVVEASTAGVLNASSEAPIDDRSMPGEFETTSQRGKDTVDSFRRFDSSENISANKVPTIGKQRRSSPLATSVIAVEPSSAGAATATLRSRASSASASLSIEERALQIPRFRSYDVSARALKGGRLSMEDEYIIADGGRFAAVFDGHGGSGVSRYLRKAFHERVKYFLGDDVEHQIEREVKRTFFPFLRSANSDTPAVSETAAALRSALRSLDQDVMLEDRFRHMGSTAVAVVLHEGDDGHRTLLSANIGDSRAVLSRKNKAVDLTRDHKPNNDREKARILALGEEVEWDGSIHRVRSLSLSRAIGDKFAKPAVSSEVDIRRLSIKEGDEFVILASDGLWDVMTSQEAVDFVRKKLTCEATPPQGNDDIKATDAAWKRRNMSRFVANEALRRGSADNVCVIMVWLNEGKRD